MTRIMAIDYGTRRIGVALSDTLRITAQGFETISWNGENPEYAIVRLCEIIQDKDVGVILIGRPTRTDGGASESQRKAEMFGSLLASRCGVSPIYVDERYTTVIASRFLSDTGVSGRDKKKVVDQVAAEILLREYLETLRMRN